MRIAFDPIVDSGDQQPGAQALRLSDRIALFNNGRIEQIGSGMELYNDPLTRFSAALVPFWYLCRRSSC